ncbi:hypothetical protein Gotri_003718 [Gossypium trilobum]|uniref:Uncharacterized protein n=1 Tax=Gossypium trilobum TaxID=34281 RepID=A0A7J9F2S3_9ROSI|nr:hypothetical protein [Gossypium trilobum]
MISVDCVSRFFELDLAAWVVANLRGQFRVGASGAESIIIFATLVFAKHIIEANLKNNRSRDSQAVMERWCPPNLDGSKSTPMKRLVGMDTGQ